MEIFNVIAEAFTTFFETISYHLEAGTALPEMYKEVILAVHDSIYGGWEETGFDKIVIGKVFDFVLNILGK